MSTRDTDIKKLIYNDLPLSGQLKGIALLSLPAILAQIASIIMMYIDAAMVGRLGADASASIGLVASSTWILGGMVHSLSNGFAVQVAQHYGAKDVKSARETVKQSLMVAIIFALILMSITVLISGSLPAWLGGSENIQQDASWYFMIYGLALPAFQINSLCCLILQCSGNIKVPSILNASSCFLDIIYNFFCIYKSTTIHIFGAEITVKGLGLGVAGAALGTGLAELTIGIIAFVLVAVRHKELHLTKGDSWLVTPKRLKTAAKVSIPMALERVALSGALVAVTRIISPLGSVALSANSFAVTAESLCYMPGYGFSSAATTLVGQSMGAGKAKQARRYAILSVQFGMATMTLMAVIMYIACPAVFGLLTPVDSIRKLGITILRIELIAEPFYGASIVASGALCGAGDTFIPSLMNLGSIWGVRIPLSLILVGKYGLVGVWIAMAIELTFRGTIFLIRLLQGKWMKKIV